MKIALIHYTSFMKTRMKQKNMRKKRKQKDGEEIDKQKKHIFQNG